MAVNTVIFDKDGTLMDFDAFWISVTENALKEVFEKFDYTYNENDFIEILSRLGVIDGETDIDGILCKGTYEEIAEIVYEHLQNNGCDESFDEVKQTVFNAYNNNSASGEIKPTCDNIREVLVKLKNSGKSLCVITTDNKQITELCLEKLNIFELFDYIYTDDGVIAPKPNPECIDKYCRETGVLRSEIVMVGDTMTDVKFAKNAGISVICVGNENNRQKLADAADAVIPNISYIFEVLEDLL